MGAENLVDFVPFYFEPERLGKSLRKVSSDIVNTKNQKVWSTWYRGVDSTDLFTWKDEAGNFVKIQLTYCGQILEWNIVNGLRTGVVIEEESHEPEIAASEIIQYDSEVLNHTYLSATNLIKHIEAIESEQIALILETMERNLTIDSMSQEEFWSKYGYDDVKFSKSKSLLGLRILIFHIREFFKPS